MIVTDKWTLLWRPPKVVEEYLQQCDRLLFSSLFELRYRGTFGTGPDKAELMHFEFIYDRVRYFMSLSCMVNSANKERRGANISYAHR